MVTISEDDNFTGSSGDTSNRIFSDTAPNNGATSVLTINAIPSLGKTYLLIGGSLYNISSLATPFSVSLNPGQSYSFYYEPPPNFAGSAGTLQTSLANPYYVNDILQSEHVTIDGNIDDDPTDIQVTPLNFAAIPEGHPGGLFWAPDGGGVPQLYPWAMILTGTDPDITYPYGNPVPDHLNFTVLDPQSPFEVIESGGTFYLVLKAGVSVDFETTPTLSVTIRADDAQPGPTYGIYDETFTFSVADFPEVISPTSPDVSEYFFDTASSGNDTIIGNAEANTILGDGGDDLIFGQAGDDTIAGDAGTNSLYGGPGNDVILSESVLDTIVENPGEGVDTLITDYSASLPDNVEHLSLYGLASANLTGAGNALNNRIEGDDGNNLLNGLSGEDTLDASYNIFADTTTQGNDTLVDNDGADHLLGGTGDDTYILMSNALGATIITENTAEGHDLIETSIDVILAANVEDGRANSGADADITGNDMANKIWGNGEANTLYGMEGNDTLLGNSGADTLLGGAGRDLLKGGSKADLLSGGIDNDQLYGWTGEDTLIGGPGGDKLVGGLGADTFVFETSLGRDNVIDFEDTTGPETAYDGLDVISVTAFAAFNGGAALTFDQLLITQHGTSVRIHIDLDMDGNPDSFDIDGAGTINTPRFIIKDATATNFDAFDFLF